MSNPTVIWTPTPGSQTDFLTTRTYEVLLEGTRGGGKTDALLMSFAQYVGRGYGDAWTGIIFRLTYPQLADIVTKSQRWFYQIFPNATYNASDHVWVFNTGEKLYFRYGETEQEYWNYHGHEYPFIGFEELTNWKKPDFFESMLSCCRSSFPGMPRMIRSTTNPYGVGHGWVKRRYRIGEIEPNKAFSVNGSKPRKYIHSTVYENSHLLQADPDYLKTLTGIEDPVRRKAWLEGSWDIHAGSFLEGVWDAKKHVVEPFTIPASWKVWKAMDWGYRAPFAVLWFALDQDGCIYVWRELYGAGAKEGMGTMENAADVAERIHYMEKHDARFGYEYRMNLADPAIFSKQGSDRSIGQIFRDHDIRWIEAWNARGSRINGAQEIVRLLAEDKLKFFKTCKHCIRTIPALPPDENNPEDVDTTMEDHAWDALRYGVMRKRRSPDSVGLEQKSEYANRDSENHLLEVDYGKNDDDGA